MTFNLTIISILLSIKVVKDFGAHQVVLNLAGLVALFTSFCLTLLGLWWLLVSQNLDSEGLSRPWPFTLGAITTFLALSQTVTAFMHDYLIALETGIATELPLLSKTFFSRSEANPLGELAVLILLGIGGGAWILMTYVAPIFTVIKAPLPAHR